MELDPDLEHREDNTIIQEQLRATLREDVARTLRGQRPLLTHLNADTTWLLSLPIPQHTPRPNSESGKYGFGVEDIKAQGEGSQQSEDGDKAGKKYFHILIDPWLRGSQSDVAQFFSQQWHASESVVQTIAEVEDVIADIEDLAASSSPSKGTIDVVVVSHEFTDHMHRETLLEVPASVPVFAPSVAAGRIRSWRYFDTVVTMPTDLAKRKDWRSTSVAPLPSWLGISRLGQDKVDLLYYHAAVMIAFPCVSPDTAGEGAGEGEAVIYTPHGITPEDLKPLATAEPPIQTLALLHGIHDFSLGAQLNLGAHNGLKVQRLTKAKYWVGTHDEMKRGGGLVSWFLKREPLSVKEALARENQERREAGDSFEDVHFVELGNGESLLLE